MRDAWKFFNNMHVSIPCMIYLLKLNIIPWNSLIIFLYKISLLEWASFTIQDYMLLYLQMN